MLRKLRRRFIWMAMLSVSIVLTLIIGGINIANYINVNRNLDARLGLIAGNGGEFPDLSTLEFDRNERYFGDSGTIEDSDNAEGEALPNEGTAPPDEGMVPPDEGTAPPDEGTTPPDGNDPGSGRIAISEDMVGSLSNRGISEESQFVTRYFTVELEEDGTVIEENTTQIAAVTESEADNYAGNLYDRGKTSGTGFINGYKYLVMEEQEEEGDSYLLYIFLDSESEMETARAFLIASVGISLVGMCVVLILVIIFSGMVVKPMAESYEKQKRFITDASHEIKTPLTIIDANTEVLEMMEGENEWTEGIRKQIKRLTALTNKLVFLSRMDEEATKLEMCEFSLSEAAADIAEGFEAVADAKNKHLEVEIQPGIVYNGDEKNIRQLISLLLDNAMKYSDENGTIRMKLIRSGKNQILTVWNTVDEIEKGNQNILFERFYRADASHNSKTGGFGIGLSVAQAIVVAHKGKISAKSEDGKSILFTIIL